MVSLCSIFNYYRYLRKLVRIIFNYIKINNKYKNEIEINYTIYYTTSDWSEFLTT